MRKVLISKPNTANSTQLFVLCSNLLDFMTSGPVVAMEIMGSDVIRRWREMLGPTNSEEARSQAPKSVRAIYGTDQTKNAAHGSDSTEAAARASHFVVSTLLFYSEFLSTRFGSLELKIGSLE